ncbi:chromosome partitioning protein ParB [Aerococcus urinaehominis]|uniref:Chromosome partitioning protein ParB n=1 Tax=Aerococcus urinaehominis TaxID=128944 RepID=A0A0X8FL66_9LACT|nr:ParB/RepB/Spo0J family partition protein [Aerococcus urinaehominis]AMB99347.1 chromosome partitioning protein ParB [Aerococcus urinaehominis]SDM58259.1 chromosome segregation DNA-binding protein [Aerococcus urinaehominis]
MTKQNKKKSGLGQGMGAFFNTDAIYQSEVKAENKFEDPQLKAQQEAQGQVSELAVDEIRPNPYQPRHHFDQEALQELAQSIKQTGLFQPITVRQSTIKGYELIAGERRLRAAKLAGLETIPAIVRDVTDSQMVEMAIVENLQREDLNPIEEAMAYQQMMDQLSLTQAQVADRLTKSRSHVANHLRLLRLNPEVQEMVQTGQLSMGQARTLLGLKHHQDQVKLAHKVVDEGMTVRQLEDLVQALNEPAEVTRISQNDPVQVPAYVRESEDKLMDKFGTAVKIKSRGHKGKIEIEYLSEEDLTRILDLLDVRIDD